MEKFFSYFGASYSFVVTHKKWIVFSFLVHLITAFFSEGYYSQDEHFQVLEFMNAYLGNHFPSALSWEFDETMRPWLQPTILALVTKFLALFGVENPHSLATCFRIISAALGFTVTALSVGLVPKWITRPSLHKFAVQLICALWILPFIHVRPSSEGWSSSVFCIGLFWVLARTPRSSLVSVLTGGFILGLAFELRYQTGIMFTSLFAWICIKRFFNFARIVTLGVGFLLAIGLGLVVDYFGYGIWTLTPWNYFNQNLILQKYVQFYLGPWYYYVIHSLEWMPPLTTILLVLTLVGAIHKKSSAVTFVFIPFFLTHFYLASKQMRFLFPLFNLVPFLVCWGLEALPQRWSENKLARGLFGIAKVQNWILLAVIAFYPIRAGAPFYRYVYKHIGPNQTLYTLSENPYQDGPEIYFYRPKNLQVAPTTVETIKSWGFDSDRIFLFFNGVQLPDPTLSCEPKFRTLPLWLTQNLNFGANGGWVARSDNWTVFECRKNN